MLRNADTDSNSMASAVGGPNWNAQYTIAGWVIMEQNFSPGSPLIAIGDSAYSTRDLVILSSTLSDSVFNVGLNNNADGGSYVSATSYAYNTPHHFAMIRSSSTSLQLWMNYQLVHTLTGDVGTARGNVAQTSILSGFTILRAVAQVGAVQIFNRVLTPQELYANSRSYRPTNGRALWSYNPYFAIGPGARGRDYSGNLHDFVESGGGWSNRDNPSFIAFGGTPIVFGKGTGAQGGGEPPAEPTYRDIYVLKRVSDDNKVHYKQIVKR